MNANKLLDRAVSIEKETNTFMFSLVVMFSAAGLFMLALATNLKPF